MSLDNATVLNNLIEQKNKTADKLRELAEKTQQVQATLLKLEGAIDVLTQIEENNAAQTQETQVEEEQVTDE